MDHKLDKPVKTTCCYCGVGCGILVQTGRDGNISIEGDKDHPANKGMLCSKGMNLHYTVMDQSDRLLYPEMRFNKSSPRQRVSWDVALERTAAVFKTLISKYGPDSVAFYASGQCLTEEYYVVNKLVKGFIGTNNIDTNSRLCMSSAVAAYKMSLGEDCVPVSYDDIELSDCIFVAGGNPAWCHPILWRRVEAAKERNPSLKIIVSDPRKTQTCAAADVHLQINPGTDVSLHHALGRCLIESGDIDLPFIQDHSSGFEGYRSAVFSRTVEEYALICGINEADIRRASTFIGNAKAFITMWTMGLNQSVIGVNKNLSLINLNLITGQIGKPGAGPFSLTGQPNAMGGREVGGLSNMLPAHRDLSNSHHREEVERFWKIPIDTIKSSPGLTATEMFEALNSGKLKAIWILCTNPLVSLPDVRTAEEGLKKAKFVVVQDISNKPETLRYADVVLPAAGWLEKEGTMTNADRRISYLNKITEAPGEARPDAEIICDFARRMGYKGFDFKNAAAIYDEHCALTAGTNIDISDLSHELLKRQGSVQWPYTKNHQGTGTSRLFTDRKFFTPSGKATIHSFADSNESEKPDKAYPLILTTGRVRDQWHTRSKTGKVNKLNQHVSTSFLEIHPFDARERGIEENGLVEIFNSRGNVRVQARISGDIKKGLVFLPMHWGKILNNDLLRANNLTSNLKDPISKEPNFKYSTVQVRKYKKQRQKIIVIGAGAGSCSLVKSYRALNKDDEIVVFSREDFPFYNRILLPDYISNSLSWSGLVKMTDEEEEELNIRLLRGVSITGIDRATKTVTDSNGDVHNYDVLIMATGSRAATLRDLPEMNGIFTMRSRNDADKFKRHIHPEKGTVVIVGGGLLGIELAASLCEMRIPVTVIHRTSRLMDRQLDPLGSQLLHEELTDKGITIHYNDEIDRVSGQNEVTSIKLKSGLSVDCQAIVTAIGTVPNIELIKNTGIAFKRGVLVDEYLRTNDPDIFAIGEIAEFKGAIYGISAAAEQQAEIVAGYLNGDVSKYYEGTMLMNILKMHGTQLCSLGLSTSPAEPGYEEVVFIDKARRYYKKCIVHHDRLVGAILIGDRSEFTEFRDLIQNKIELSDKRLGLLRSGKKADPVIGKIVCSCNSVGEGNIQKVIKEGTVELAKICNATGAGLGCGSCRPEVKNILERNLKIQTMPAILV